MSQSIGEKLKALAEQLRANEREIMPQKSRFKLYTDEELRARYPVKKPVDTEEEGIPF